jgi:hypothetical protein
MPAKIKKETRPVTPAPPKKNPRIVNSQQWLTFILFGLAITVILLIIYQTFYRTPYSATGIYLGYASRVFDGQMPYRDFNLEYPPLALLFFLIPRLFTAQWTVFAVLYQSEILIFAWLGLWVTFLIARKLGKAPWKLLAPYTLAILFIGPIIGQQYDIFPAVMMLFSIYYFWLGRHKTSWLWLAFGILTKLYPALLVPLYALIYLRNRQFQTLLTGIGVLVLTSLIMLSPFLISGPQHLMSLVEYHSQRGIQVESAYGATLLLANQLGWTTISLQFNYGSWNVAGHLSDTISHLSIYLQALVFLIGYVFIWTQIKKGKSQFSRLGAYILLLLSALLFTSKVFSPQYIIWLLPVLALVFTRWRWVIWITFAVMGIFTYIIFPLNYFELLYQNPGIVMILALRDVLLVMLAVLAAVSLKSMKTSD